MTLPYKGSSSSPSLKTDFLRAHSYDHAGWSYFFYMLKPRKSHGVFHQIMNCVCMRATMIRHYISVEFDSCKTELSIFPAFRFKNLWQLQQWPSLPSTLLPNFFQLKTQLEEINCTSRNEKTSTRFQFLNRDFLIALCTTSFCHITQHSKKQGDTSETSLFADNSSLKASAAYMRSIMSGLRWSPVS